jgi:hypothetical protein
MRFPFLLLVAIVDSVAAAPAYSTAELENIEQAVRKCGEGIKTWQGSVISAIPVLADCQNVVPVVEKAIQITNEVPDNTPQPDANLVDDGFEIAERIVTDIENYSNDAILRKKEILRLPIVGLATALKMIADMKSAAEGAIAICLKLAGGMRIDDADTLKFRLRAALDNVDIVYHNEL